MSFLTLILWDLASGMRIVSNFIKYRISCLSSNHYRKWMCPGPSKIAISLYRLVKIPNVGTVNVWTESNLTGSVQSATLLFCTGALSFFKKTLRTLTTFLLPVMSSSELKTWFTYIFMSNDSASRSTRGPYHISQTCSAVVTANTM